MNLFQRSMITLVVVFTCILTGCFENREEGNKNSNSNLTLALVQQEAVPGQTTEKESANGQTLQSTNQKVGISNSEPPGVNAPPPSCFVSCTAYYAENNGIPRECAPSPIDPVKSWQIKCESSYLGDYKGFDFGCFPGPSLSESVDKAKAHWVRIYCRGAGGKEP
ncbi:hypothetical protein AB3N59_16540 [Leptospira sp. WS92.C1]